MTQFTVAEMMRAYAEDAQDLANQLKVELNYTEDSLFELDTILEKYHQGIPKGIKKILSKGPSEDQINQMAKIWGAYLGETIIKQLGGEWIQSNTFDNTIAIKIGETEIYPPAKIYKRIKNGSEDNINIYFKVLKQDFDC
ncbi:hypothetical protein [Paenibacillus sp. HB172176]|uniref:hypothetical protein n=1 Tax=Paenibacillus sp. HB172176 TaxID=2493690 RepID=UPI0014394113|nr:hypothetical protein [Paenibacillus sp. HB172176]